MHASIRLRRWLGATNASSGLAEHSNRRCRLVRSGSTSKRDPQSFSQGRTSLQPTGFLYGGSAFSAVPLNRP